MRELITTAERYEKSGYLPIFWLLKKNDSGKSQKRPIGSFVERMNETKEEFETYRKYAESKKTNGIGICLGHANCIDLDMVNYKGAANLFEDVKLHFNALLGSERSESIYIEKTVSGGFHFIYRTEQKNENKKVAAHYKKEAFIELRAGNSGLVTAPTEGYEVLQGEIESIPTLTEREHGNVIAFFSELNEEEPKEAKPKTEFEVGSLTPFDDYYERCDFPELLTSVGWQHQGGKYWVRPNKGIKDSSSATFGYNGLNVLYNFSSSVTELEPNKKYTPAQFYAAYHHGGDLSAAAKELYAKGYGDRYKRKESIAEVNKNVKESVSSMKLEEIEGKAFYDTPLIPQSVYDYLPEALTAIANDQDTKRERDVTLLATITTLSAVCGAVGIAYDKELINCNMLTFISTPAAGGKGKASKVKEVLRGIKNKQESEYKELAAHYSTLKPKQQAAEPEPIKQNIMLPDDPTGAGLLLPMANNEGVGYMFVSEAKAIANKATSEHGKDIKVLLLKSFHNESVINYRVGRKGREEIELERPQLAATLTGVLSDLPKMFGSSEDGLLSRFLLYAFNETSAPRNPFADGVTKAYEDEINVLSDIANKIFYDLPNKTICGTIEQGKIMQDWMVEEQSKGQDDERAQYLRVNVVLAKICGVLSAVRAAQSGEYVDKFDDDDFAIALELAVCLLKHSYAVKAFIDDLKDEKKDKEGNVSVDTESARPEDFILSEMKEGELWDKARREKYGSTNKISDQMVRRYLGRLLNSGKVELVKQKPKVYKRV